MGNRLSGVGTFVSAGTAADGDAAGVEATVVFAPDMHYRGECLVCQPMQP